jgi:hypothetical protein
VVDFPISNLAQDRDINFSMTVTMSNELNIWWAAHYVIC